MRVDVFAKVSNLSRLAILFAVTGFLFCAAGRSTCAQQAGDSAQSGDTAAVSDRLQSHLKFGEFTQALQLVDKFGSVEDQDRWRAEIARRQFHAGARDGSFQTYRQIENDALRSSGYHDNYQQQFAGLGQVGQMPVEQGAPGAAGGITAADFNELINLIQSTIQPDSWADATGVGTIIAYPAGVYVDGEGLMQRIKPSRQVDWDRVRTDVEAAEAGHLAGLRKISLTRLERQLMEQASRGIPPTEEQRNLGGMVEVKYLLIYPETRDVVIAGPAGRWTYDDEGRARNLETGKPCLQLDDLVVCLRSALESDAVFGCSIDPKPENLKATHEFLQTSTLTGEKWRDGLRAALGKQVITVHGIDPQSRVARIIVEADYRMKLIGMGIEPGVVAVPSYLERLTPAEQGQPADLARWWFTLNYDAVQVSDDRQAFAFSGNGVKLASESEHLDAEGNRQHTGKSSPENAQFARDFTRHYEAIADKHPVFAELKNVFDLALVAAIVRHENIQGSLNWEPGYFLSQHEWSHQIVLGQLPREVESVMNFREVETRKGSRRIKQTLVGVSGGVQFTAADVVTAGAFQPDSSLATVIDSNRPENDPRTQPIRQELVLGLAAVDVSSRQIHEQFFREFAR